MDAPMGLLTHRRCVQIIATVVGGFNLLEKYAKVKLERISPIFGMKMPKIFENCHHLDL